MTIGSNATIRDARRLLLATIVTVMLSLPAALLAATGVSDAATVNGCRAGDFCIYDNYWLLGGMFSYSGSDQDLGNDRFVGGSQAIVSNHGRSWVNNGYAGPYDDVLVFDAPYYGVGGTHCVPNGVTELGVAPTVSTQWVNRISSYAWVNAC